MNASDYTVKEFIQTFRDRIGDTSQSVPSSYIISYLNTALRRIARTPKMDKLLEHKDTFQLAGINRDGTPSASWSLGNIGEIIDITQFKLLKTVDSKVCRLTPDYTETDDFFNDYPLPEQNQPGDPGTYTIEQIATVNRLILNRPPKDLTTAVLKYTAFHPRVRSEDDILQISWGYMDVLEESVIILHKVETTDMATGRALYEDLDLYLADAAETLHKRKSALPYRRVVRSF